MKNNILVWEQVDESVKIIKKVKKLLENALNNVGESFK